MQICASCGLVSMHVVAPRCNHAARVCGFNICGGPLPVTAQGKSAGCNPMYASSLLAACVDVEERFSPCSVPQGISAHSPVLLADSRCLVQFQHRFLPAFSICAQLRLHFLCGPAQFAAMSDGLRREKSSFGSHSIQSRHTFTHQHLEVKRSLLPQNQIIYLMYSIILTDTQLCKSYMVSQTCL